MQFMKTLTLMNRSFESKMLIEKSSTIYFYWHLERASSIPAKFMGIPLSHSPPLLNQMHISPLELLHRVPLLDFDLLPGNCSSMAASSLLSLPNVVIS
ncbi:unnamed protein product, partial [Brassica oleracea var. botrytis]